MNSNWRRALITVALFKALLGMLPAQNLLYVEHEGQPCLVLKASDSLPCIEVNGKVIAIHATRFALKPVDEYIPFFISVRDLKLKNSYEVGGYGSDKKSELQFEASFEAGYRLDDVYILLELTSVQNSSEENGAALAEG